MRMRRDLILVITPKVKENLDQKVCGSCNKYEFLFGNVEFSSNSGTGFEENAFGGRIGFANMTENCGVGNIAGNMKISNSSYGN